MSANQNIEQWKHFNSEPNFYTTGVKIWRDTDIAQLTAVYTITLSEYFELKEMWKEGGLMDKLNHTFSLFKASVTSPVAVPTPAPVPVAPCAVAPRAVSPIVRPARSESKAPERQPSPMPPVNRYKSPKRHSPKYKESPSKVSRDSYYSRPIRTATSRYGYGRSSYSRRSPQVKGDQRNWGLETLKRNFSYRNGDSSQKEFLDRNIRVLVRALNRCSKDQYPESFSNLSEQLEYLNEQLNILSNTSKPKCD